MENPFNPGYWTEDELSTFGFCKIGTNVRVAKNCTIIGMQNISIADNVRIDGPTVMSASSGYIRIGSHVHIGGMAFLAGGGGIELADFSGLSQGVRIYSTSDDYSGAALTNPTVPKDYLNVKVAPVTLGRHVIVGSGSVILPGCSIGEGSSIGALSLVTKSLDPWGVYFGTPARRLRARSRKLLKLEQELVKKP
ncbi:acyltransferase [Paraburkholderia sediminicola]|uniref:acyltransferase n=1 Tax=Paraburkholderia sediminicola TaxID=458836 RepID=UPI0038BD3960